MKKAMLLAPEQNRDSVFGEQHIESLRKLVDLKDCCRLVGDLQALKPHLGDVEIICSTWGMMKVDEEFLAAAPELKAIFYGAGTVRRFATDAMWDRGILLTSAAAANAVSVAEFTRAGVATVCMMARSGLLLPYCGDDWFAHIRRAIEKCADAGIGVWIYDEDPCPSGSAGGWVTLENPGNLARGIELSEAEPNVNHGELFCFPTGKLLWAVAEGSEPQDLAMGEQRKRLAGVTGRPDSVEETLDAPIASDIAMIKRAQN